MKKFSSKMKLITLLCAVSVCAVTAGVFATTVKEQTAVAAETATVNYNEYLGLEDRTSWASGGHADIVTLGIMDFSVTEGNQYFKSSVNGCWYRTNSDVIAANNGVDILQYIYINGESARDLLIANQTVQQTTSGTSTWLSNAEAWPIAFETGTDCWIRIDKTKFDGAIEFVFKAGFSLIRNDGTVISITEDIGYNYVNGVLTKAPKAVKATLSFEGLSDTIAVTGNKAIGTLPAVPENGDLAGFWTIDGVAITKDTIWSYTENKTAVAAYALEYKDLLGLEDRTSWGAHDGEYYFGGVTLEPLEYFNTADSVCSTWYVGNKTPITANNGVDIMEYIYVNDKSARELITANVNGSQLANSCSCWLSNPAASPVYVETTNDSGIIIRILKAYVGDSFTITFKEGFSLIRNDNQRIYVSEDINYTYADGALSGEARFTVSFEGLDKTQRVKYNAAIGKLPAVPEKTGYDGAWAIDGQAITADSIYTYGENKTATAVYTAKNYTLSFEKDGANVGSLTATYDQAIGELPVLENKDHLFGVWTIDGEEITADTVWNFTEDKTAVAEYVEKNYVLTFGEGDDAQSVDITYGVAIGDLPAIAEKTGYTGAWMVGEDVLTAETVWTYNENKTAKVVYTANSYTLTFGEAEDAETKEVTYDAVIGELPAVTEKEGYSGVWAIDEAEITAETVWTYAEDKTAKVAYTVNKYNVTFDGENAVEYEYGSLITKPADPTKEATNAVVYTFDGWYNGETQDNIRFLSTLRAVTILRWLT